MKYILSFFKFVAAVISVIIMYSVYSYFTDEKFKMFIDATILNGITGRQ